MKKDELLRKIAQTPEVEPDAEDLAMLQIAKRQDALEKSGKIVLRLPKTLHSDLVTRASKEGVSLNQYCLYRLSANNR